MLDPRIIQLGRSKFKPYTQLVNPTFRFGKFHHYLAEILEKALNRVPGYTRLMLSVPPRHGKSEMGTQLFSSFALGYSATLGIKEDIMLISHTADMAQGEFGKNIRSYMSTPIYREIFPETSLIEDAGTTGRKLVTPFGSALRAFGVRSGSAGKAATILLVDDPIGNRIQADSPKHIARMQQSFGPDAYSRLEPGAIVIIIQTRWGPQDLIGYVQRQYAHDDWLYIRLPALCDSEDDPLGRAIGDPLVPFRYSRQDLLNIKKGQTVKDWMALYQQDPVEGGSQTWRPEYLNKSEVFSRAEYDLVFASWDTATELGDVYDHTACTIWGIKDGALVCLWARQKQVKYPELKKWIYEVNSSEWLPDFHLVEKSNNGTALGQDLEDSPEIKIVFSSAHRNKKTEFNLAIDKYVANEVFYNSGMPGDMSLLVDQLALWPNTDDDDLFMSNLHAVRWFQTNWDPSKSTSLLKRSHAEGHRKISSVKLMRKEKKARKFGFNRAGY